MPEIGLSQAMYKASALSPAECICCLSSPCEPCQHAALTGSVGPPVGLMGSVPKVGTPLLCAETQALGSPWLCCLHRTRFSCFLCNDGQTCFIPTLYSATGGERGAPHVSFLTATRLHRVSGWEGAPLLLTRLSWVWVGKLWVQPSCPPRGGPTVN